MGFGKKLFITYAADMEQSIFQEAAMLQREGQICAFPRVEIHLLTPCHPAWAEPWLWDSLFQTIKALR